MKRKILFFTFVLLAFSWRGQAQFTEDFEGNFLPSGWAKEIPDTSNDITQSNSQNHTPGGSYSAAFSSYDSSTDYNQYLFSPAITVQAGVNDRITFWHRKYNSYDELLEWGISTGGQVSTDVATWTAVTLDNNNWQKTEVDLSAYVGQTIYFAWHYYGDYLYYVYLDDVVNDAIPTCPSPNSLSVSNITDTSATLTWTDNSSGSATYTVQWREVGTSSWNSDTTAAGATSYTLNGLTQNTEYEWQITANCGGGDTSQPETGPNFRTDCGIISAPFVETFENSSNTIYCWANETSSDQLDWLLNSGGTSSSNTGPDAAYEGNYYAYVESSGSSNNDAAVLYSPQIDLNGLNNPYLKFYYHMYGAGMDPDGSIDVSISTDNGVTYTSIFNQQGNQGNQWNTAGINLSNYSGVAIFKITGTVSSSGTTYENDFAIDYFQVIEAPTCPDPTNLTASNITTSQAELSWTSNGNSNVFNIELGTSGFTPTGTPTNSGVSNPFTITGLNSNTSYDYYVQADCGNNGTSNWVGPYTFTTLADYCGGDHFYDSGGANGDYSNNENITTTIYPANAGDVVTVNFLSFNTEEGWDGLMVYDGPDTNSPLIDSGSTYNRSSCPNGAFTGTGQYAPTSFTSTHSSGALTFVFTSDGSGVRAGWDAEVTCSPPPSCPDPTSLSATNITSNQADLTWNGNANMYNLEWGLSGFTQGQGTTVTGVTAPYTLTGLSPQTTYDYYVQADCGNGDTSNWVGPYTFTTIPSNNDCNNATELSVGTSCNFTTYSTTGATDSGIGSPGCGGYQGGDVWFYFTVPTTGSVVIDTNTGQITDGAMAVYSGSCGNLTLIDCDDDSSDNGLMPKFELTGLTPGETLYIRFWEYNNDNPGSFDICVSSTCPEPSNLTVNNVTITTADLSWTDNSNGIASYIIEWRENGATTWNSYTTGAGTTSYTLTNLNSATEYEWQVSSDCGNNSSSSAVSGTNFTTDCDVIIPDYLQTFDNMSYSSSPDCWKEGEGPETGPTSTGASSWTSDGFANNGSSGSARFNLYNANDQDWLISPTFDLSLGEYQLEFDVAVTTYTGTDASDMGSDDQVKLLISTDNGLTWSSLMEWNANNVPSNTGDHITIDLNNYTQAEVKFAFWANEGDVDDTEDYNFYIDNFSVNYPSCSGIPILPDYLQVFNHYLPTCWSEAKGSQTAMYPTNSRWTNDGFLNNGTSGAARIYMYGTETNINDWLISPEFDLSSGSHEVSFSIGVTGFSNSTGVQMGADDFVKLMISTDGGTTWTAIHTWDSNNSPSNIGDFFSYDLSNYTTNIVKFAFYANTGQTADNGYNFYVDNFAVTASICPAASNLNAIITGSTTATLTWVDNSGGNATYTVEWKAVNDALWNSATTGAGDQSYDISGLVSGMEYQWRLIGDCSGTMSNYVSGNNFVPTCVPIIPDYFEDFTTFLSECWSEGKGNMSSYYSANSRWTYDGFANDGTTGAARIRLYNNTEDSWLISPEFDLTGASYSLNMDVAVTKFSGTQASVMGADDKVVLKITTDGGNTWNDLIVWDASNTPSNTGDMANVDLSAYSYPSVQFAIVASDGTNDDLAYNFYVDNFTITSGPVLKQNNVTTNVVVGQNNDKFKLSTSTQQNMSDIKVYDLTGRLIYTAQNVNKDTFETQIHISAGNVLIFHIKLEDGNVVIKKVVKL